MKKLRIGIAVSGVLLVALLAGVAGLSGVQLIAGWRALGEAGHP